MNHATLSRWCLRLFLAVLILVTSTAPRPTPVTAALAEQSGSALTLLRGSYVGGSERDVIHDIAVDAQGNVYMTGETQSPDFPRVNPLYNHFPHKDDADLFVTKLDRDGNVIFSSVIGGEYFDAGFGVATGPDGSVYVVGDTESTDFPVDGRLISRQEYFSGIFVMHISADGSQVLYSTGIGNTPSPYGDMDIAVDANGNAYITGAMSDRLEDDGSHNFPIANPVQDCTIPTGQNGNSGWSFGFVTEISPSGSSVVFSTCIHDQNHQDGRLINPNSIALDSQGNIYIAGNTASADLPLVNPVQQVTRTCDSVYQYCPKDMFVMKIRAGGGDILYSTYLASDYEDRMDGIAVGPDDSLYATGMTSAGRGFPETRANQGTCTGDSCTYSAFVSRIAEDGGAFHFSTLFGEISDSPARRGDIAVDLAGDAYLVGTMSTDSFPVINPIHPMTRLNNTAFVARFDAQGEVHMSSLWSGDSDEEGLAAGVDVYGNFYIAGRTSSDDLPRVGVQISQPATCAWSSGCLDDGFLAKFGAGAPLPTARFSAPAFTATETDGSVTLTVRLDPPAEREVTVGYDTLVDSTYNTYDDTALAPNDYAPAHGAVTFAPGQTEASFTIPIHDNPTEEVPEHFKVGLKTAANAWTDRTPAQVTIMDGCETNGWERVPVPKPNSGADHRPVALAFSAPDDGWMVGNYLDTANSVYRPLVHHYDGTSWQVVSLGDIRAQFNAVLAFGKNDVWAAGMGGDLVNAVVFHYDGTSWTAYSPVPPAERAYSIDGFSGTGDNDLWVLGYLRDTGWDPDSSRILLHWDGASWTTFYIGGSSGFSYSAVRSTGPGRAVLIGTYYNSYSSQYTYAAITTYDANGQTGGNMDNIYGYSRYLINADVAPNGEVFAVGNQYDDYLFVTEEPLIIRYFEGGNLNAVTTPYTNFYNSWVYDESSMHNDTTYLNAVRAFSENDVWAMGETRAYSTGHTTPVMLHYDGNVWDRVNVPAVLSSLDRAGDVMWGVDRAGGVYRLSPQRQCASSPVPPAGGQISSGKAAVTVPPNAVEDTIFMTLKPVLEPSQPLPDGQTLLAGVVVAANDALGNQLGQIAANFGLSFNLFGPGSSPRLLAEEPQITSLLRWDGAQWQAVCSDCAVDAGGTLTVETNQMGEYVVVRGAGNPPDGTASVTLSKLAQVYDGEEKPITVTTDPPGLSVHVTYNGSSIPPVNAGSYAVTAVVEDAQYQGSASGTLVITPAPTTTLLHVPNPAVSLGRAVTLSALVSPFGNLTGSIHGTVTFYDGSQVLGTAEINYTANGFEAVLTVSDLALGEHTLTASYAESDNLLGSTSAVVTVNVVPDLLLFPLVTGN